MAQLAGVAKLRGELWGESVREAGERSPWPTWDESERVREIARRKVADIAGADVELLETLARMCAGSAADAYANPRDRPGGPTFTVADPLTK